MIRESEEKLHARELHPREGQNSQALECRFTRLPMRTDEQY